jgi:hypothetical protein
MKKDTIVSKTDNRITRLWWKGDTL